MSGFLGATKDAGSMVVKLTDGYRSSSPPDEEDMKPDCASYTFREIGGNTDLNHFCMYIAGDHGD